MRIVQDRLVGAVETEHLERTAVVAALFGTGEEFAVGIGTRTAFAECVIGIGIDRAVAVDLRDVALARRHVAAPLQHDGGQAVPGQKEGGEQPRRAHAHHHWRQGGGPGGGGKDIGLPLKQGDVFAVGTAHQVLLVVGRQLHGADVVDIGFFPGVDGLAGQGQVPDQGRAEPQQPGSLASELLQVPVHGEGKIADSYHVIT